MTGSWSSKNLFDKDAQDVNYERSSNNVYGGQQSRCLFEFLE